MQERKHRWSRIEDLTGLILQQPADINALLTALGYDKSRCCPGVEGNSNSIRFFDLSTDFSLFTGEDFVDDQPSSCPRPSEDGCSRVTSDWQNKSTLQDLPSKLRSDTPSTNGESATTASHLFTPHLPFTSASIFQTSSTLIPTQEMSSIQQRRRAQRAC